MPLLPFLLGYYMLLTHHSVQLNNYYLYLINLTFVINITQYLIANDSLYTPLNNFASTHPIFSYQDSFERADLPAHAYKFSYNSDASILKYLRSKIVTDYCATRCCIIHFELSKLTPHPVIEFPHIWACQKALISAYTFIQKPHVYNASVRSYLRLYIIASHRSSSLQLC